MDLLLWVILMPKEPGNHILSWDIQLYPNVPNPWVLCSIQVYLHLTDGWSRTCAWYFFSQSKGYSEKNSCHYRVSIVWQENELMDKILPLLTYLGIYTHWNIDANYFPNCPLSIFLLVLSDPPACSWDHSWPNRLIGYNGASKSARICSIDISEG